MALAPPIRLAFGGDVMLGRVVAETMRELGPDTPLEAVAPLFRAADLGVVNLECAVTSHARIWSGPPKAFYFRADPHAATALARAGIGAVSLANNHSLDFGAEGLVESLELLADAGIATFGAGRDWEEASRPALVRAGASRVGFVGFTDHPAEFAAGAHAPGVAYLDLVGAPEESLALAERGIGRCRAAGADLVVASLHCGPNFDGEPAPELVRFAHLLVDAGADVIFGHSPHVFHGVEVFRGRPILYAAGDLVDDYYVGGRGNDRTLVFTITFDGAVAQRIDMTPCFIEGCRVVLAPPPIGREIAERITELSARFGTHVRGDHAGLRIDCEPRALEVHVG